MTSPRAALGPPLWPAYLATFTFMLGQWASGVAVPLHVQQLGGSLAEAGTIAAVRFGLGAFLQLPFGAVADAWGTRRVLFMAVIGNAAVNLVPIVAAATGSVVPLYVWALLSGLTASMFLPAISAYVAASAPDDRRGSAFGWATLATHSGVAAGPALGGLVWEYAGVVPTYLVASGLGLVATLGPILVARSVRTRLRLGELPRMVAEVARRRAVVGMWTAAFAIGLPWGAVAGLFPIFGTSVGLAAGTVGLLLAAQSIANGASRVPLGRLLDRRAVPWPAAAAGAIGYGTAVVLLGFQTDVPAILGILLVGIVALAFTLMLVQLTISKVAPPDLRGTGLGGYGTALSAGLGIGPFIAGAAADAGGFGLGFGLVGGLAIGVAVISGVILAGARRAIDAGIQRPLDGAQER